MPLTRKSAIASWTAQILIVVILGQTLFFKFTGAAEARFLFETLGVEPWGRIGSGIVELAAVLLLLTTRRAALGALLAAGTMVGAIASHLGPLGIEVQGDGGTLFVMGIAVLLASLLVLFLRRDQLPFMGTKAVAAES